MHQNIAETPAEAWQWCSYSTTDCASPVRSLRINPCPWSCCQWGELRARCYPSLNPISVGGLESGPCRDCSSSWTETRHLFCFQKAAHKSPGPWAVLKLQVRTLLSNGNPGLSSGRPARGSCTYPPLCWLVMPWKCACNSSVSILEWNCAELCAFCVWYDSAWTHSGMWVRAQLGADPVLQEQVLHFSGQCQRRQWLQQRGKDPWDMGTHPGSNPTAATSTPQNGDTSDTASTLPKSGCIPNSNNHSPSAMRSQEHEFKASVQFFWQF